MRLNLLISLLVFPILMIAQKEYVQTNKMYLSPPKVSAKSNLFQDSMMVDLFLRHPGTIIRYGLGDSIVNEQSPKYDRPIRIKKNTLLSARAFHPDYLPSKTYRQYFYQAKSFAEQPDISCMPRPKAPYNSAGPAALLDMVKGTKDFRRDKSWLGFQGDTVFMELKFSNPIQLEGLTMSVLQDQGSWIFLPQRVEVWANKRMLAYTNIREAAEQIEKPNATSFVSFNLKETKETNYLIKVINLPALPDWHPGSGGTPWLFVDELFVQLN